MCSHGKRAEPFRYGTRNYLAVISTVNCSASTSKYVSERIRASGILKQFPFERVKCKSVQSESSH